MEWVPCTNNLNLPSPVAISTVPDRLGNQVGLELLTHSEVAAGDSAVVSGATFRTLTHGTFHKVEVWLAQAFLFLPIHRKV